MSLRSQAAAFARQGAAFRQEISGSAFTYLGASYCGSFGAITSERTLDVGGWNVDIGSVVRVARAAYPAFAPALGGIITITATGLRYEIGQIRDNPHCPELVVGLVNPQAAA